MVSGQLSRLKYQQRNRDKIRERSRDWSRRNAKRKAIRYREYRAYIRKRFLENLAIVSKDPESLLRIVNGRQGGEINEVTKF